jgi:hypothetical protein
MSQIKSLVDMLLTPASNMYVPEGYISEKLLPFIGVAQSTGKLAKYGTNHLRLENSIKAGRGKYREVEAIARSQTSYAIEGHGLEGMVTKEDYKNVLKPYDAEKDEVIGISTLLWVEKEKILADNLASTSIITQNTTLSAANQYNDYNNSSPVQDFIAARAAVKAGCGVPANVAWMDYDTANYLRFHPQILDMLGFKWASPGGVSDDALAQAMGVKKVLISNAMYESAKEGQASSLASIWGKHVWFAVIPDSAQPYQVSLGYRLGFQGEAPRKVYKLSGNFNPPESTKILVEDNYDFLLSSTAACYMIKNAIA